MTGKDKDVQAKMGLSTYMKIMLHGAKHSTAPVMGLLLGTRTGTEASVQAVFPVLHSSPSGPLLDIAISIAPKLFPNTTVIGIYFSNDLSDSDLAPVYITRIVKSMTEKGYADPCMVIQLKNTLIEKMDAICIKGTQDGQSVNINVQDLSPTEVNSAIQNSHMLTQFNIRKFIDFEDHSNEVDDEKNSSKDGYGLENAYVDAYGAF